MLQTGRRAARNDGAGKVPRRARRRSARLAAAGVLAGALALAGCAWGGGNEVDVEVMDAETAEAVIDELSDAVAAELEAAELEQIIMFTGGSIREDDEDDEDAPQSMVAEVGLAERPVTLVGACAGAEGFATVGVVGGGTAVLQCTIEGEPYDVQTLIERFVPGTKVVTTEMTDMPVGAVWSIAVAGVTH